MNPAVPLFFLAESAVWEVVDAKRGKYRMSRADWRTLIAVASSFEPRRAELGYLTNQGTGSAAARVNDLRNNGLVILTTHPDDTRRTIVEPTELGWEALDKIAAAVARVMDRAGPGIEPMLGALAGSRTRNLTLNEGR